MWIKLTGKRKNEKKKLEKRKPNRIQLKKVDVDLTRWQIYFILYIRLSNITKEKEKNI